MDMDPVCLTRTVPAHVQHWYKDMRHSTKLKDAEGQPAFALVNRATGLAIKHSLGQSHPVSTPAGRRTVYVLMPCVAIVSLTHRTCCCTPHICICR